MKDTTKKYTNGEVTIVWKPNVCIHSTICFKGLGEVFDPTRRPWITPEKSTTEKIIEQVKKCPSGALSYYLNQQMENQTSNAGATEIIVEPSTNGPLLIHGTISVKDSQGNLTQKDKVTAFCRCGGSGKKPFCDGSHKRIGFMG